MSFIIQFILIIFNKYLTLTLVTKIIIEYQYFIFYKFMNYVGVLILLEWWI